MGLGEGHVGQHVVLGIVHAGAELWPAGTQLVGDLAPDLCRGGMVGLEEDLADGSGAASTSCAMPWPTCPRARTPSSPLPSARSSSSPTMPPRHRSGARSPTSCVPAGQSSAPAWTMPSTTCWPT